MKITTKPKRGPYVSTKRAGKMPGKTVKTGGTEVMKPTKKGQKGVSFEKGGLHKTVGVDPSKKIPMSKVYAAKAGKYGPKGAKQANMYLGMLKKGQKTAAANRRKAAKKY